MNNMGCVDALRKSDLFKGVSDDHVTVLESLLRLQVWEPEHFIFAQNEPASRFYILIEGRVELVHRFQDDSALIGLLPVEVVKPYAAFGWSALVEPFRYTLTAKALNRCSAYSFNADEFKQTLLSRPELAVGTYRALTRILASRLTNTWGSLAELALAGK